MGWTDTLNEEQREAVLHNEGPLLILAGAGSGKTTVLVSRAGRLIDQNIAPSTSLCVLTFTNKAAKELKTRVRKRLGDRAEGLWAGTFHSFGLQLLRTHAKAANLNPHFGILDPTDSTALVKELLQDFKNQEKEAYDAPTLVSMLGDWRNEGRTEAKTDEPYEAAAEWLLPKYLKKLELLASLDFDSLILKPLEIMEKSPELLARLQEKYRYLMVDEFQDTNEGQMGLIRKLAGKRANLAVVGDDDQAIYGWRGARVENILSFERQFPGCKTVRLEKNYRSTPEILSVANSIIQKNPKRFDKVLKPTQSAGTPPEIRVFQNETEEVEEVVTEIQYFHREGFKRTQISVLYRSNSLGASLEAELRKNAIPYSLSGGTAFFDRKETKDVLAYLRCALTQQDLAFRRILNTPARGIGEKTVEQITDYSAALRLPFFAASEKWKEAGVDPRAGMALDTLHTQLKNLVPSLLGSTETPGKTLLGFLQTIGYPQYLEKSSGDAVRGKRRWGFLEIFAGVLDRIVAQEGRTLAALQKFLDSMDLRDHLDERDNVEKIQLMTLHACKGLEFPVVILLGVEEDMLPHRTLGSDVSEERRLFYVGVTRAEKHLVLGRCLKRKKFGKEVDCAPSRFLLEIPSNLLAKREKSRPVSEERRKALVSELFKKLDGERCQSTFSPER